MLKSTGLSEGAVTVYVMSFDNHVTFRGNLTKDVELRELPSGTKTAQTILAVNKRWRNGEGRWEETTTFLTLVLWGHLAVNAANSLSKGDRVWVVGELEQRSWRTDGQPRTVLEVKVEEIGPSLRYATASVVRARKGDEGSDDAGGQSGEADRAGEEVGAAPF